MNRVLADIKSIGGVVGSFLYDLKGGVLAADVPGVFKAEKLAQVGRSLAKTFAAGNLSVKDLQDLVLQYEELLILARPVEKNVFLVVLCDPGINVNLLVMSLRLAMEEVREAVGASAPAQPTASRQPASAPSSPPPPQPLPSEQTEGAALEEAELTELALALAKVMGPMASVVFAETLAGWRARTGGARTGVGELIEELCGEIGQRDKVDRFLGFVPQTLKGG